MSDDEPREVTPLTFWKPGDPGWAGVSKDMRPTDSLTVDPVVDPQFMRPVNEVNLPEPEQPEQTSLEVEAPPVPDALAGDDDEDDAYGRDT